jgi:hypothetical protein
MKTTKLLFIRGGAAVALLIVYDRWDSIDGYAAGFLTPGLFTILARTFKNKG